MLEDLQLNLEAIPDEAIRRAYVVLLNLLEQAQTQVRLLQEEVQRLKDEIARLKGEQGRPNVRPNRPTAQASGKPANHSSEQERRVPKPWKKHAKLPRLQIDRTVSLSIDPLLLPPDARFKGCVDVVIQDVVLQRDNICFRREKYWSAATGRTYLAPLPEGYEGEFGPGIKSLALALCYGPHVSHAQVATFLRNAGTLISTGEVSDLLTQVRECFHRERDEVVVSGLGSSRWQHGDITPTRVNGGNEACHVLCNPFYTAYHTTPTADRLSVLEALQGGRPLSFRLDAVAFSYLEAVGLSLKQRRRLAALPPGQEFSRAEFEAFVAARVPGLGAQQWRWVLEAAALSFYWGQDHVPVVDTLLCDDAPVYRNLTRQLALCWVHDGRHYKKLCPCLQPHQEILAAFRKRYWDFYRELLAYREQPSAAEAARLQNAFDELFSTQTDYSLLNERIEKTHDKKAALLLVLSHPELPLHNNPVELGARRRARKRDVSFGPRSRAGVRAWDTFQTLAATCAKHGVGFYYYLHDRITGAARIPRLAALITEAARSSNLSGSWAT